MGCSLGTWSFKSSPGDANCSQGWAIHFDTPHSPVSSMGNIVSGGEMVRTSVYWAASAQARTQSQKCVILKKKQVLLQICGLVQRLLWMGFKLILWESQMIGWPQLTSDFTDTLCLPQMVIQLPYDGYLKAWARPPFLNCQASRAWNV